MTNLNGMIMITQELFLFHAIVFFRVGLVVSLCPGFGERSVPIRVKLGLALAFTAIVTPVVGSNSVVGGFENLASVRVILTEVTIGLIVGVGLRLLLLALQTAGSMAAQATSLSQILGSAGITPLPAIGHVLVVGGLALAMMMNLHVHVAEMMVSTYSVFPMGVLPSAEIVSQWGVSQVAAAFSLAFSLAAPFIIVSVLYNLTLGVINRAMPQLMVVFVGAPVITAGGLGLLALLAPTMLMLWVSAVQEFASVPFGVR